MAARIELEQVLHSVAPLFTVHVAQLLITTSHASHWRLLEVGNRLLLHPLQMKDPPDVPQVKQLEILHV